LINKRHNKLIGFNLSENKSAHKEQFVAVRIYADRVSLVDFKLGVQ